MTARVGFILLFLISSYRNIDGRSEYEKERGKGKEDALSNSLTHRFIDIKLRDKRLLA